MAPGKVKEIIKTPPAFTQLTDLAAAKLGGTVLYATDDFFAEKENLIQQGRGVFIANKYTDRGKWMDGWESRRKRTPGHDWIVVRLATAGMIKGVDIDTNFFLGNHPPFASIEATNTNETDIDNLASLSWQEILPKSPLDAGSQNFYEINSQQVFTHVRLHIYPDGGVARLKVYGEVYSDPQDFTGDEVIDLAAAINGGKALACNDMFFSSMNNLLMPERGENMGDGWETKRNRTPNNKDWVIVKLAFPGIVEKLIIDTCHFKGNYPDSCSVEGCMSSSDEDVLHDRVAWKTILPVSKLSADAEHTFVKDQLDNLTATHIRLNIFPDGGISRLRVYGKKYN